MDVDWPARKARARAYVGQGLKPRHRWTEKKYEYDRQGRAMTHDEYIKRRAAIQCCCMFNDAIGCFDARNPGDNRENEELGLMPEECSCSCHELWEEFMATDDDEY